MARSIKEIQEVIYSQIDNQPALAELNSTSKTAIYKLWIYIIAFVIHNLELLFDIHSFEVSKKISELKPHTPRWYRNMALAFQYGFDLLPDSPHFDNSKNTDDEIESSKVVKYSAVTESEGESRLIIKITGEDTNGKLSPLDNAVESSFKQYMQEVKDAGVRITVINYQPDLLKLNITIVRDKLVMNENGMDLLSGKFYVNEALQEFMKELPFDGELSLQALTDKLQKVTGVLDLSINQAQTSWIDGTLGTYGNLEDIYISKIPNSGYFEIVFDTNINNHSIINYV